MRASTTHVIVAQVRVQAAPSDKLDLSALTAVSPLDG